ncbi:pyridoxamine 5'-phosphate oxidase family protein [Georgenia sp. MJ170]|uniref:pyridoxamine 5'-phosphate oxidase family protein n=1 Tax=Georgenia sunbinii TaxID=3117728 RepID=UPI002F269A54
MAIEELSTEACRRLLDEVSVGWLAHCTAGRVHMVPVNFVVHAAELVFRTSYGTTLEAIVEGHPMTFGAGEFDAATQSGWSVTVSGAAHLIGDPLVNPGLSVAEVWPALPRTVPVGLALTGVTGRRVRPGPTAPAAPDTSAVAPRADR